ncbi:MAG: large ribosomal subunit protein bL28 [bacterium]
MSHSHRVIKRKFLPNLQKVKIATEEGIIRVYVCSKCLKAGKVKKAV